VREPVKGKPGVFGCVKLQKNGDVLVLLITIIVWIL